MGSITIAEAEEMARNVIKRACPPDLIDVVSLAVDRRTEYVLVVLKCKDSIKNQVDDGL